MYLPEPHASLLNGVVFGVNLKTSRDFVLELKKVGLTHIVVLSGMNITILCSIISVLLGRLSKKLAILLTILIVIFFIAFVGLQAPAVRAALMSILTLVAILFGRKSTALYTLFISGILSLIISPSWITSISFYLSYGATLGLILFGGSISPDNPTNLNPIKHLLSYCKDELRTSLAAQIFTAPLIFIFFKQISLIAPISNILVSWIVTPIMIIGFITAFLGKIHYALGLFPSYVCYLLLDYLIHVIHLLSQLPFIFIQF